MEFQDILSLNFYGNSVQRILIAAAIFFGGIILLKLFQLLVVLRLKKLAKMTHTEWDDELVDIVATIKPHLYTIIAFYAAMRSLLLSAELNKGLNIIFLILITFAILQIVQRLIGFAISNQLAKTDDEKRKNASVIRNINLFVKIGLWSLASLLILQNVGVNVSSLIAGLGIGGLAIALAMQNILSDLFSSFSIYFDKPFVVDDFIQIGTHTGTVKSIGLKTTRLQTLQGEELVVSNKELTSTRIQNFGKMKQRRVVVTLGLEYDTSSETMKNVPGWLKHIIDNTGNADFDRAHFKQFSDSSLDVELVYFVSSSDYVVHMDTLQNINIEIKEKFEKEKVGLAFPTQTLYVKK